MTTSAFGSGRFKLKVVACQGLSHPQDDRWPEDRTRTGKRGLLEFRLIPLDMAELAESRPTRAWSMRWLCALGKDNLPAAEL